MSETVNLRQIIEIILRGKKTIIISVVVVILFTGIFTWFAVDEKYKSKAVVQLSSGVQDTGIISNYVATEFTPVVFMQRLQNEELMGQTFKAADYTKFDIDNLTINNPLNTNLVELTYEDFSADKAQNSLQLLLDKTQETMNSSVKETLHQLEETYLNESNSLSTEIESLMTNYNNIIIGNNLPEVLILQTISSSQFVLNLTQEQTNALKQINGNLQNQLLQVKAQIDSKSDEYRSVLSKYQSVKTGLDSFKPDPFIRVIIEPTLPKDTSYPNKILNMALAIVIGLMMGIGIVFFRNYWKISGESNN